MVQINKCHFLVFQLILVVMAMGMECIPAQLSVQADVPKKGEKKAIPAGDKKQAEGQRKVGDENQPDIRGTIQKIDIKKGTLTVLHRSDNGNIVHKLNLAGKDIPVTGVITKLADLRPGVEVYLQLSETKDVIAIRTARGRPRTRIGRVFAAYDKNFDNKVTFEEWLALREGKIDEARRARERGRFDSVDTNRDGTLSFEEFARWRNGGRRGDGDRPAKRREGDKGKTPIS